MILMYDDGDGLVHICSMVEETTHCGIHRVRLFPSSTKVATCLCCHGVALAREQMPEWLEAMKKEFADLLEPKSGA